MSTTSTEAHATRIQYAETIADAISKGRSVTRSSSALLIGVIFAALLIEKAVDGLTTELEIK